MTRWTIAARVNSPITCSRRRDLSLHHFLPLNITTVQHKYNNMVSPDGKSTSPKSPLTTSKAVEPIPTPTYPNGQNWTVLTTTTISAPTSAVLAASIDTASWPKWNSFTQKTEPAARLEPGVKLAFHSKMGETGPPGAGSDHEVVSIDETEKGGKKGYVIVWKTINVPAGTWLLRAERVQEIMEGENGQTEYKTWGTFGGPGATAMSWFGLKDQIVARFEDWANDLKEYVEKKEAAEA